MNRFAVALDLDGTLISHWDGPYNIHNFGEPLPDSVEFTKLLRMLGADIVIFTCRGNPKLNKLPAETCQALIKAFLDKHGYNYDSIYVGEGKPCVDWYIDDRAVPCVPESMGNKAYSQVLQFLRTVTTKVDYTEAAQ